ncbi:MAG: hypothetical protein L0Y58_03260 [Verrucomicrobia subdivision 3 bacterium]|nr:hypothetical protein [Limisphaerales bacterium]
MNTNRSPLMAEATPSETPAPALQTNRVEVPPALLNELNRFVTLVRPYGLDEPIKPEDILHVEPDRVGPKARMVLATKTHLAEIDRHNLLRFFYATYDRSNPVAEPEAKQEAMRKWSQATGKWSPEEALAETYRIMERLGIRFKVSRYDVDAPKLRMKNPQGDTVEVTPFYMIKLYDTNDSMVIDAEFRIGELGPGRLTMWWANLPREAYQGATKQ